MFTENKGKKKDTFILNREVKDFMQVFFHAGKESKRTSETPAGNMGTLNGLHLTAMRFLILQGAFT